jgi:hypothetical protein
VTESRKSETLSPSSVWKRVRLAGRSATRPGTQDE